MEQFVTKIQRSPQNFRDLAQQYSQDASLLSRTEDGISRLSEIAKKAFQFNPLAHDEFGNYRSNIGDIFFRQERIVDLLVLAALGQAIEKDELKDQEEFLEGDYIRFDFFKRLRDALKEKEIPSELHNIEEEWSQNIGAQSFMRMSIAAVKKAAQECGISMQDLPTL